MPTRTFIDTAGVAWTVWTTRPTAAAVLRAEFAGGWLTFEATTGERRRLMPVPGGWEDWDVPTLRRACLDASPVTPPRGSGSFPIIQPEPTDEDPPETIA